MWTVYTIKLMWTFLSLKLNDVTLKYFPLFVFNLILIFLVLFKIFPRSLFFKGQVTLENYKIIEYIFFCPLRWINGMDMNDVKCWQFVRIRFHFLVQRRLKFPMTYLAFLFLIFKTIYFISCRELVFLFIGRSVVFWENSSQTLIKR